MIPDARHFHVSMVVDGWKFGGGMLGSRRRGFVLPPWRNNLPLTIVELKSTGATTHSPEPEWFTCSNAVPGCVIGLRS